MQGTNLKHLSMWSHEMIEKVKADLSCVLSFKYGDEGANLA